MSNSNSNIFECVRIWKTIFIEYDQRNLDSKTTLETLLASLGAEINKFLCFGIKYQYTEMFNLGFDEVLAAI